MHNSGASRREIAKLRRQYSSCHHPRRRVIQYSGTPVMESKGRGVLDTPLEPVIGLAEGETRWRGMTTSCGAALSFSSGAHSRDPLANPSTAGVSPRKDFNALSGSDCGNAVGFHPTGYKNRAYQGEIT
jgi:hypothetical protein